MGLLTLQKSAFGCRKPRMHPKKIHFGDSKYASRRSSGLGGAESRGCIGIRCNPLATPLQLTSEYSFTCRHVARISSRWWPAWRGPSYPLSKTKDSSELAHYFLVNPAILFSFFGQLFYFSIPVTRGRHVPPLVCVPAAGRIYPGEIYYGVIPMLNTPY